MRPPTRRTRPAPEPVEVRLPITAIIVGQRHRKYLGDIEGLAASIKASGLLHPVVVTPTRVLIAGERRILAACHLGWTDIPVRIIDPPDLLLAEADENTQRLDFTPSEAVAIAAALRPIEEAAAKERQGARTDLAEPSAKLAEGGKPKPSKKSDGESRKKVAAAVGMSATTLEKAEAVVAAAEKDPELGAVVAKMDETGKVDPAFREVKKKEAEKDAASRDRSLTDEERDREEIARMRVVWAKGMESLSRVISLDPEKYVPFEDSPDPVLDGLMNATRRWLDKIDSELAATSGLRAIK